jgi:hypothetical protein
MKQMQAHFARVLTIGNAYNLAEARRLSSPWLRHGQRNEKSSTDAYPSRASAGVQMATRQRVVQEPNQQECLLDCTHVTF